MGHDYAALASLQALGRAAGNYSPAITRKIVPAVSVSVSTHPPPAAIVAPTAAIIPSPTTTVAPPGPYLSSLWPKETAWPPQVIRTLLQYT